MMNKKQQLEQDAYLKSLLGNKCFGNYHTQPLSLPKMTSTLGRMLQTTVIPESKRKADLGIN